MIKKMLATTALVALMAGPAVVMSGSDAVAEEARGTMTIQTYGTLDAQEANGYLASNLMGRSVYTSTAADAERIGEIDDAIVGQDGRINAVILGVGGFLGIGEKDVAVNFSRLSVERETDGAGYILVSKVSKEELEGAPSFERRDTDRSAMSKESTVKNVPATSTVAAVDKDATTTVKTPQNSREAFMDGKTKLSSEKIEAETIDGAWVYDSNFNHIGEVGEVLLTGDGKVEGMVIDVGGFLGLGEKPVAMSFQQVELYRDGDDSIFVTVPYSEEQLEVAAEYDAETFAKNAEDRMLTPTKIN